MAKRTNMAMVKHLGSLRPAKAGGGAKCWGTLGYAFFYSEGLPGSQSLLASGLRSLSSHRWCWQLPEEAELCE